MAIQLIDRYLQAVDVSKHELQLIGSTGELKQKSQRRKLDFPVRNEDEKEEDLNRSIFSLTESIRFSF